MFCVKKKKKQKMPRTFRVISLDPFSQLNGKIKVTGTLPSLAAKKILTSVAKHTGKTQELRATVTLEEITRGSGRRQFHYEIIRERLTEPRTIERDGRVITYHFKNHAHKL